MSRRNGDRARFHKDLKRKLLHRQRIQALMAARRKTTAEGVDARAAASAMEAEGGPASRRAETKAGS